MAEARLLFIDDAGITTFTTLNGVNGVSGVSMIRSVTKTLTNAQIIGATSTFPEIIAPTEILEYNASPTTLPIPTIAVAVIKNVVPYGNLTDARFILVWGSDWSLDALRCWRDNSGTLNQVDVSGELEGSDQPYVILFNGPAGNPVSTVRGLQDNGLYFVIDNGGDPITGGGDGNTMTITVNYLLNS